LRSSDALGIQKENLEIQLKGVQADLNKKMAELKKFLDVEIGTQSPILRADEIKSAALGDFRKVAEDLSDALSIYYINSQTNILFSKAVEDAALAGHVPSERVYKTLVSQTARHDVESAQTALKNVLAAEAVLKEVRERVYSYQGKDRNMFMLNEFANIFMNVGAKTEGEAKKLLYQAEMLRAAFPEFEGIIASQMQVSNRLERAMFLDPLVSGEGGLAAKARLFAVTYGSGKLNRPTPSGFVEPGIAEKLAVARNASEKIEARLKVIDDELKSMGTGAVTAEQGRRKRTLLFEKKRLDANFWTNKKKLDELDFIARSQESGGQTGIRKQAGAKTAKGRGTEGEALEGMAETGVRQIASVSERASEWDKLWPELNSNMKKLRKIADNPDTDDSTRQLINGLVQEYDEAASRARAKMKYASDTLQRIVGGKSQRMQGRVLATLTDTSFGKPFGLGGSLKNALSRDSASAMDTFWADLMGGTKFDPRADYRVARVGKTRTGARKLVSTDNTAQRFVNVFPNEFSPTGYADADGRFVNATGELVAPDGTVLVDEVTGRPLRGRKSSKPTIPVRRDESHIGKVEMSARRRLNALRAITDDAEFIDIDVLQGITITPESPGGFGFDNLAGPRGYANQLEIQASMLDQKIQQATALEKRISKDKRALSKLNKPEPNARTQKLIEAERRLSSAAKRKKSQLEQSAMHTRALERQDFNNFLLQLSAMSEDSAVNANWGLNIIENPLPKAKVEHVYSFRKKALENQRQIILGELKKEQDKLNKLMMTESYQSREAQRIRARMTDLNSKGAAIAKDLEEVDRILRFDPQTRVVSMRGVEAAGGGREIIRTARLQRIEDVVPGLKFGFSRDEWNALWTKPRTKAETAALNNEYNALKAQLSALHRQQDVVLYSQFPYNFPAEKRLEVRLKIDEVVEKMDALRRELNMDAVRDDAIRKAKMLHQEFGQRGKQIYRGREVSADKALEKFMNTRVADAPDITFADDGVKAGRRRTLRQVFVDSEEGKHLAEFNKAKSELKTVYRDAQAEMVDNWRIARRTIQTNISNARKEIKELNIAQGVKEINETILKAEEASKGKLPKVAAKTLKGDVKKVVKGVEKNIRANRVEEPFFVRSEELFGSLEQANKNELSALQLRRRQVAQQIADMDYAILAEQTSQREAKEVVESLTKLSEREAAVLGLPSRKKLLKNVSLAKQLAEQTQRVSGISDSLSEKLKQIGSEYTTLSNAVTDARQSYNNSLMFRKTAEENVEQAKKAVESIRELSKRATKTLTETKGMKKDPALVQTIDNFLEEVNQLMPLIDDPRIDKEVRKSISIYMQSKTRLIEAETAKTLAGREKAVADGLKGLTAKELGSLDLPPGAVNIKVQFDEGFVELSRFFPNIGVRKELAEIVQNVHRLQDPALVRELSKVLGTYTKFFKGYATLSPGFHIRNAFSNFFMLFAAGGRIDYLGEGIKWSQMWSKMSAEGKTFDQFIAAVPEANRQMVSDAFMAAAASGGGMTDDALREGALFGTKTSRKVGRWIEQHSRFMLAYDGMRQGMDFNTSAARVRRFLIDYENVSSADQFMRQIIPFWMWTSRNLPLQVQNIWMNPKPYQIYGSIKRNLTEDKEEQPVPQWMEEVGAFRLPFGKDLYAVPDFGFNRVNQQVQELRDPARFMANLNPLIRLPIELSGGRQLYSNREFSPTPIEVEGGLSTALQPLLEALGYGETGPDGKKYVSDKAYYALRNLAPFLGTAERLVPSIPTYQQRGTTNQWLGFTGVPVRQNTAAMQEGELKRRKQLLQEFLSKQRAIGVIQED